MPIGWFPYIQQPTQSSGTFHYEGLDLDYWADHVRIDDQKVLHLDGNVKAVYGPDVLTADHMEAHSATSERFLTANGKVVLTDPDGSVQASDIRISWDPLHKSAFAKHVVMKLAGSTIHAETAEILPEQWTLSNYYVTLDKAKQPLFYVKGDKAVIRPGHNAILTDSQLYVLGQRIIGFKEHTFNLDPRAAGFHAPTLEYRPSKGIGYNWTVGSIIDPNTAIQVHSDASFKDLPGYGTLITKSFVPTSKGLYPIAPHSEFALRFDFAYLESVLVEKPSQELSYFDQPRQSISFESTFNAGIAGRGYSGEVVSVPGSFAYEIGGRLGPNRYLSQFKLENIDSYRGPFTTRGEWLDSLELHPQKIGPNLFNMSRIDSGVYQSAHNYLWARGSESLVFTPNKNFTLGAAVFAAASSGVPDFDIDPLYYRDGASIRADYRLGPRRLSVLVRYDTHLSWFDNEYVFTQAMGPLEAFISHREYPGDSHFGVMLRVDQLEPLLTRLNWKRSSKTGIGIP